ncbi:MAG TPA: hypothetical protein VLJ59_13585, partial [Mycobacteriales bacterium]|nr:hypothetical protein [Mycobacteriales bacterium]
MSDIVTGAVEHSATFDPEEVVRLLGRRVLDVVDPDHADELLRRRVEREAAEAYARRGLRICPAGPGLRGVCGFLDTEGAETLRVALDPLARGTACGTSAPTGNAWPTPWSTSLTGRCGWGAAGQRRRASHPGRDDAVREAGRRDRCRAVAHRWRAARQPGPPHRLRRPHHPRRPRRGEPAAGPRAWRPAPRRRAAPSSSATAGVFPACDRPYQWCQAHHCVHWADGGRTDQNNG